MNRAHPDEIRRGRTLVVIAAFAMILPEILGPLLTPELGGIDWIRLALTTFLAVGIVLGIRWIRWLTVGLVILGLLMGLVGSGILRPPSGRIPFLLLLVSLNLFVLYVLLISEDASRFFEVRSKAGARLGDDQINKGAV